jgi:hypothetical protein
MILVLYPDAFQKPPSFPNASWLDVDQRVLNFDTKGGWRIQIL